MKKLGGAVAVIALVLGAILTAKSLKAVSFRYGFGNGKETDRPAEKTETPKQISDTEKE